MLRRYAIVLAALSAWLLVVSSAGAAEVPTPPLPVDTATAPASAQSDGEALVGVFEIDAGRCGNAAVPAGSWFRMVQPNGDPESGPFVDNGDSPCEDKSATPLVPGSDKGLATGRYQPQPDPPFDGNGNGAAARITRPQKFYGVDFAVATNPVDPQTSTEVAAPTVSASGGNLSGDVRAFGVAWNGQHFNQGAPKPDGSTPGHTTRPSGTYDESTQRFMLEWTSHIQGGPFNGFTGVWHFEGTFRPERSAGSAGGSGGGGSAPSPSSPGGPGESAIGPSSGSGAGSDTHPRTGGDSVPAAAVAAVALALAVRRGTWRWS